MKQIFSQMVGTEIGGMVSETLSILTRLFRVRLASLVALSTLSGYLFAAHGFAPPAVLTTLAIWLLAAGCSALNQLQEINIDGRMGRTRSRPLPSGELTPGHALLISGGVIGCGLMLLMNGGQTPLLLGLLAILWYNGVYTPLKKKTAWAVFPGAICGALPPLIGYSAAGGSILDPAAVILAGTLLIWQVPHFWLLAWRYRQDQLDSGLPTPFRQISEERLFGINACWMAALFLCYFLFILFGMISNTLLADIYLALLAALLLASSKELLRGAKHASSGHLFHLVNLSMALLLMTLFFDNLG
ncbi:protoheme IX farnesyltransferase [Geopsychrobacter electrodiphilus]|uniref:protoheme IX farnesyltransferase n=1 Tax=Geopsychrobacter electrodiphilus TaxID=225196 RepID=UPI00036F7C36|nr:protoheme IX farnesyltransferase [Geopsychrobacter electrodiphilus]